MAPDALTNLEAVFDSSEPAAAAPIAEVRRLTAAADQAESTLDVGRVQELADVVAKDLADTKAALEERIAKQMDAAYRQAALPNDAEAKSSCDMSATPSDGCSGRPTRSSAAGVARPPCGGPPASRHEDRCGPRPRSR